MILFLVFRLNTFTSNVSNLLLPLESEGAGGFEAYPNSEIPNKYTHDAFLMTYLPIFFVVVVVVFFTFWHFKGFNRRSRKALIL